MSHSIGDLISDITIWRSHSSPRVIFFVLDPTNLTMLFVRFHFAAIDPIHEKCGCLFCVMAASSCRCFDLFLAEFLLSTSALVQVLIRP